MTAGAGPAWPDDPGNPDDPGDTDDRHPTEALSALLDGELGTAEAAGLRRHLAGCPECGAELERLGEARRRLRSMVSIPPPPGLDRRVRNRARRILRMVVYANLTVGVFAAGMLWLFHPERPVTAPPMTDYMALFGPAAGSSIPPPPPLVPLAAIPPGYLEPPQVDGFGLASVWRLGPELGTAYGAGGSQVTVLEETGHLVPSPGTQKVEVAGRPGLVRDLDSRIAFTSQMGPVVVTMVGDPDDVPGAVGAFRSIRSRPPWTYRMRNLCRSLVDDLTGG